MIINRVIVIGSMVLGGAALGALHGGDYAFLGGVGGVGGGVLAASNACIGVG
jgi:hypothetical protein